MEGDLERWTLEEMTEAAEAMKFGLKAEAGTQPVPEEGPGKLRLPDLEPCRLALVASDFVDDVVPLDWTELPKGAMIAFTRTDEPTIVEP